MISGKTFDAERSLYGLKNETVSSCVFAGPADGESPFKECDNITVKECRFELRYPFWHVRKGEISGCELTGTCRAALWYDSDLAISNSRLHGIKALRECEDITLENCDIVSDEFGWRSRNLTVTDCSAEGMYPFFEVKNLSVSRLTLTGKYSFQYTENGILTDCELTTKDAFWHSRNVTLKNCRIRGEYLAWYSENLHLINCVISGTQPLCYCKGLIMENCRMEDADLAFERSEINATLTGEITSIKNPAKGSITAEAVREVIRDPGFDKQNCPVNISGKIL